MNLNSIYKLFNIILMLAIVAILIPILHSSVSETSRYNDIYKKITSNFKDKSHVYNETINQNILDIMRDGNNTVYLRHSDDDDKNRESYLDALSTIDAFQAGNFNSSTKLTKKGRYQSEVLALFFKNHDITFEEVWSSPISRCSETAYYFSQNVKEPNWLYLNGFSGTQDSELEKLRNLFYKKILNQNLLIVAHGGFPDYVGIPSNLEKSDFLVYNHDSKSVILHGTMNGIMNFYTF